MADIACCIAGAVLEVDSSITKPEMPNNIGQEAGKLYFVCI